MILSDAAPALPRDDALVEEPAPPDLWWRIKGEDRVWSARAGDFVVQLPEDGTVEEAASLFALDRVLRAQVRQSVGITFSPAEALAELAVTHPDATRIALGRSDLTPETLLPGDDQTLVALARDLFGDAAPAIEITPAASAPSIAERLALLEEKTLRGAALEAAIIKKGVVGRSEIDAAREAPAVQVTAERRV